MKAMMSKYTLFMILAVAGGAVFSGCRKKKDTIAKIYVKDWSNQFVEGATVILYGKSTINTPANVVLYDTTLTNSSGVAVFNYNDVYQLGQAGVAVLDIKAFKDGAQGQGIIKVEQETTSEETVYIE
jgi:hypothetical protein